MKRIALLFVLLAGPVLAQSAPHWAYDYIVPPGEWDQWFAKKLDAAGGVIANSMLDAIRSNPTATQTGPLIQPGDNMALPSLQCTPVGQNSVRSDICINMTSGTATPQPADAVRGNNYRAQPSGIVGATTVNIGFENYLPPGSPGVGMYVGAEGNPGAGATWAINTVTNILQGDQGGGFGLEADLTNISCDPGIDGTPTCAPTFGLWVTGLTGYTNSAGIAVSTGGGSVPQWHTGVEVTSALDEGYYDRSNATFSFRSTGTHGVGFNSSGTTTVALGQFNGATTSGNNPQLVWVGVPQSATVTGSLGTTGNFSFNPASLSPLNIPSLQMSFLQPNASGPNFQGSIWFDQAGGLMPTGRIYAPAGISGATPTSAPAFPAGLAIVGGSASAALTANGGDLVVAPTSGTGGIMLQPQTNATLPTNCAMGTIRFVLDARNVGEASGAGTGAPAYCNRNHQWLVNGAPIST